MIPPFGLGEVLPPFVGNDVVGAYLPRSPYLGTVDELVDTFCTSPERAAILSGLLEFRAALRDEGFRAGFQWIDGSFVEDCERVKGRPPGDIDVVSVLHRPFDHEEEPDWLAFLHDKTDTLFDPDWTKKTYSCDAYFIDLDAAPSIIAELSAYWIGLFSHQRDTFRWKGMVQVAFEGGDADAVRLIAERARAW